MTIAAALFTALDLPDDQRLLAVLGMMQILPEEFEMNTALSAFEQVELQTQMEELQAKLAMQDEALKYLTDICVTQVGADYNDRVHAAFTKGTALRDWAMEQYLESQKAWRKEVAKRKELAEQEPVPSHWDCGCGWHNSLEFPVCAACSRTPNDGSGVWRYKPVPPPDLQKRVDELEAFEDECANLNAELKDYQETLAENAALKKKLAEQQAIIKQVKDYGFHHCNDVWNICVATEKDGTEELASYLSAARAEGVEEGKKMAVPEGWQVVPKEPTPNMVDATWTEDRLLIESHNTRNKRIYAAMLAASPTNKDG